MTPVNIISMNQNQGPKDEHAKSNIVLQIPKGLSTIVAAPMEMSSTMDRLLARGATMIDRCFVASKKR